MNNNLTKIQNELIRNLDIAVQWSEKSRLVHLVHQPWKTIFPKVSRRFKLCREIKARTFWNGQMNLLPPEIVSTFVWRYGYFEADVCLSMINYLHEGMIFIDIGAHFGFFSLLGSYLVGTGGKVLSVEPMPVTQRQLRKNVIHYSRYPNIELFNIAAYSDNTRLTFFDYGLECSSYNSAVGARFHNHISHSKCEVSVKARKIDDVLKENKMNRVDLIKIDAESSEIHVLQGMNQTLQSHNPKVILEVGDTRADEIPTTREIIHYLQQMDYSPYEVRDGKIVVHSVKEDYEHGNLIFLKNS